MYSLPKPDQRTVIVGSTGSGKTFLAVWLLSTRDWHKRPWFIFDFKGDKLIGELEAEEINVYSNPPKKPGLYVIRPVRFRDDEAVEFFLWKVWANENAGVYVDEGYMLGNRNAGYSALLTQGRAKNIELITLVQRPVWIDKAVFSEANHFYIMKLQLEGDRRYVSEYLDNTPISLLPKFHSYWYSADGQEGALLLPVPNRSKIIEGFDNRRDHARKVFAI
jgi:DNA helicase HerA-like ATPase